VVSVEMTKEAARWLTEDTRFWVVRARLEGTHVSALETLLSGAYIAVGLGSSRRLARHFVGLEEPPPMPGDEPGTSFVLRSTHSLDAGSPVIFRRLAVGQVLSSRIEDDGKTVSVSIFVRAPHDRLVTTAVRFWDASGITASWGVEGLRVRTESLEAVVVGGIAFEEPPDVALGPRAPPGHRFDLFRDRNQAMKRPDLKMETYRLVFHRSVRGLEEGAPVDLRGVVVGEVSRTGVEINPRSLEVSMLVDIRVYPERLRERLVSPLSELPQHGTLPLLQRLVDVGLRAQLRSANLLTGQQYVALDFFPTAPKVKVAAKVRPPQIPSVPGSVEELQEGLATIVRKLQRVPFAELGEDARHTLAGLDDAITGAGSLVRQLSEAAPRQDELQNAVRELGRAARAVRTLADTLGRNPESIVRGRRKSGP